MIHAASVRLRTVYHSHTYITVHPYRAQKKAAKAHNRDLCVVTSSRVLNTNPPRSPGVSLR